MISLFKINLSVKLFGFFKIPMLFFSGVRVVELNEQRAVVKIPLNWRTKNHLHSMYFGALGIGADCVAGIYASTLIWESKKNIHLSFKDVQANFSKRTMSDAYFVNHQGEEILNFFNQVVSNPNTRINLPIHISVRTDPNSTASEVATFVLTLSLKYQPAS